MAFKHNPGCNCCNRALIWDMGLPSNLSGPNWPSQTRTVFVDWTPVQQSFDEAGLQVDFALGEPQPDQDFWGPVGTVTFPGNAIWGCPSGDWGPGIDPNTDAVDLGYWSGNIFDYRLLIWHRPLSADSPLGNLCGFVTNASGFNDEPDPIPCPALESSDALWVAGGRPVWYDDVFHGSWTGRVVILQQMGAGAGYILTFQSVGHDHLRTAWWYALGMSSGEFIASDPALGLSFNHQPVRIQADPLFPDPNTRVATEDDLTQDVPPFLASPPDITSTGTPLFRSVVPVDTRGLCDSLNPNHDDSVDSFDDIPVTFQTHTSGIRKTHIKMVDDVEVKADLVVCTTDAMFQDAFAKNLVNAPIIPASGDIL